MTDKNRKVMWCFECRRVFWENDLGERRFSTLDVLLDDKEVYTIGISKVWCPECLEKHVVEPNEEDMAWAQDVARKSRFSIKA